MEVEKTLASVGLFALLATGAFFNILLIFEKTKVIDSLEYELYYKIAGSVINVILVSIISYLTVVSKIDQTYKIIIVLLIFIGLIVEIYITVAFESEVPDYVSYVIIVFNFLLRAYMIIQNSVQPWSVISLDTSTGLASSVRNLENVVMPTSIEKSEDNDSVKFINQFRALLKQARDKVGPDNFDQRTYDKALAEIIKPAVAAKDYSKDKLKEGASMFRDKSGNTITDLIFGGRRRR
jgi:hypothetical protein